MNMHLYAFGSICRGDLDKLSDVDLLAVVDQFDDRLDPEKFSIYSGIRMKELWTDGNPFAWHLWSEARLLFSSDSRDLLRDLGEPSQYKYVKRDCEKFHELFDDSAVALISGSPTRVFELSSIFLAVRNVATCFALGRLGLFEFSRFSALKLDGNSLQIDHEVFDILQRARILSTRGLGDVPSDSEVKQVLKAVPSIRDWMNKIVEEL